MKLHSVENTNVYVEKNHFKVSLLNDSDRYWITNSNIGVNGTSKKTLNFLTNSKNISLTKKNCLFFKTNCSMPWRTVS